eukprot:4803685-Pleurochrysis_carterae.AAC.1
MANFDWVGWFDGFDCCSKDFADTSAERVWVYALGETLESHGYVRARYKANLLPPRDGRPEFRPYVLNAQGELETSKSGVRFMHKGKWPDIRVPAAMETWKAAENSSAEGVSSGCVDCDAHETREQAGPSARPRTGARPWQQREVFADIFGHSMARQPAENRDQSRALHAFHTTYTTSDTVPRDANFACATSWSSRDVKDLDHVNGYAG